MHAALAEPLFEVPPVTKRLHEIGTFRGVPAFVLDVPETIPQLGYGSHQFFRYYGKFPSVVGREIVDRHALPGAPVLDCYAGSGTTLVEAQSAGLESYGLDINPLGALACGVKTGYFESAALRAARDALIATLTRFENAEYPQTMPPSKLNKWFRPEVQAELATLRAALLSLPSGAIRAFLLVAYLGIVRRVSNAYDGEVRPHVNPKKTPRSAVAAFAKKLDQMIGQLPEVDALRPSGVQSRTVVGDNRDAGCYKRLLGSAEPGLIVAHPPYLNSFNYLQVFSLEFAWAEGFDEVWGDISMQQARAAEHRAWPATDPLLVDRYYDDFEETMATAVQFGASHATVAVVIGDATIRGDLEAVHTRFWDILASLGLKPKEIWFRTTHYGIGKYAYSHRADYHGEAEKKDAVLFFQSE